MDKDFLVGFILFVIIFGFILFLGYMDNRVYILKNGVKCLHMYNGHYVSFYRCDDGFEHINEQHKVIHNSSLRKELIEKIKGDNQ